MVNVLIIGATGYIGQALSQSLLRSGNHRVFGLARTPEKAKSLSASEVIPIIGSISSPTLPSDIETNRIDIVVDVAGANRESHDLLALVKKIGASRFSSSKQQWIPTPKLGFIYCSGTWVHGSSTSPVNDLSPVGTPLSPTPPTELTSWRPSLERAVLASSDVLDVMVVRPALVYGRSCAIWTSLFELLFQAAQSGTKIDSVKIPIEPESRPALIHVDDVASGFHAAIDSLPLISSTSVYPVFDLQTSRESMHDILTSAARELGFEGKVELVGAGDDLFMRAMSVSGNLSSGRAKTLLGWRPRRVGMVGGMDVFVRSWVASRS